MLAAATAAGASQLGSSACSLLVHVVRSPRDHCRFVSPLGSVEAITPDSRVTLLYNLLSFYCQLSRLINYFFSLLS